MKSSLLSAFCASLLVSAGFAQSSNMQLPSGTTKGNPKLFQMPKSVATQLKGIGSARAAQDTFILDYPSVDEFNATNSGIDFVPNYAEALNERNDSSNFLSARTAAVLFDTLIYQDVVTGDFTKTTPISKATLSIDTVFMIYNYSAAPANPTTDNLTVKIYKWPIALSNNGGYNSVVTSTPIFTKTYSDSVLATLVTAPTALNVLSVPVGITLNKGDKFFVTVSYDADTASKFSLACAFADSCGDQSLLFRRSTLPGRSFYYANLSANSGWDNGSLSVGTMPASCRFWLWQNWQILPLVRANVDFGVSAKASKTIACPGDQITLTANGFGSNDITYEWYTSRGTLSTPNDIETTLTTDSTTAVYVVATDNTSGTKDTSRLTVVFRGVNISINGGQPVQIQCNAKGTLTATLSGFTSGSKSYTWKRPVGADTTTTTAALGGLNPGNYSVTVTNSAGCTASTTASIVYPDVNNTVSFTLTPDVSPAAGVQVCINKPVTLTNTSTGQTGWNATWYVGSNDVGVGNTNTYTFTSAGKFNVRVEADSAGCVFSSPSTEVTVLSSSNSACVSAISDVKFESNVSLLPNPAAGNVTLTVNGVEKAVSVKVYNVIGSEVAHYNFSDASATLVKNISVENFANGTYLVKVESNGKTAIKRLIVNH